MEYEIRKKCSAVRYPVKFVNSVLNDSESEEHDPMLLSYLLKDCISKPIIWIDFLFCNENNKISKQLLKKLNAFTKEKMILEVFGKQKKSDRLCL